MHRIAQYKSTNPFTAIALLYIGVVLIQKTTNYCTSLFSDNPALHKFAENLVGLIYVLAAISLFKMWPSLKWWSKYALTRCYLFILPVAYIAINFDVLYPHSINDIMLGFASRLATGFLEELLCRGLVIGLLIQYYRTTGQKYYLFKAALYSSILFGVAHLGNIIHDPAAAGAIVGQVIYATFIGLGFAACYLQTQALIPLIIIHFGIDFMSFLTKAPGLSNATTFMDTLPAVILCLPLFIYGLILLNKRQQNNIENLWFNRHQNARQ